MAFTAGAAALLVQAHPKYTPDQIKDTIRKSAMKLSSAGATAQGQGALMISSALSATPSATPQSWTKSTGTGTLDGARGSSRLILDGVTLSGEQDVNGAAFNASERPAPGGQDELDRRVVERSVWAGSAWSGPSWTSTTWTGSAWSGSSWAGGSWASGTWSGSAWASTNWSGSSWAGSSWAGRSWAGRSWADDGWS